MAPSSTSTTNTAPAVHVHAAHIRRRRRRCRPIHSVQRHMPSSSCTATKSAGATAANGTASTIPAHTAAATTTTTRAAADTATTTTTKRVVVVGCVGAVNAVANGVAHAAVAVDNTINDTGATGAASAAAGDGAAGAREVLDDGGEFLLQHTDALLHNGVGLEAAGRLDVEVERLRDGLVVERLALLRRVFELGVLTFRPVLCIYTSRLSRL
jgi:hypothetical protein